MNYTQREWDRVVGIGNPPEDALHKPENITEHQVNNDQKHGDLVEEAELLKKLRVIRGI